MKKRKFLLLAMVLLILFSTQSCVKYKELVSLNRNDNQSTPKGETLFESEVYPYQAHLIRSYDQLMIKINANEGSTEKFINDENTYNREIRFDPPSLFFNSYTVDEEGYIYLPEIENVYAKGLTVLQLKRKIDEAYKPLLKYASSTVKVANMLCTVVGEVNQPGVQYLYGEKITLMTVIGFSGDFTEFANRSNVKIIRTLRNGNTKSAYVDLTTYQFVNSEYYYVQPDDIIYVEPVKAKSFDASSRALGVIFSAISAAALIVNLIIK